MALKAATAVLIGGMGYLQKSAASLSFHGDDLDPKQITTRLGIQPTVGVRKGDIWLTARGAEKVARTGSWRLEVGSCEPEDLDGQITRLLSPIADDLEAWRVFSALYRGRIFAGLFLGSGNEGLTLQPGTMLLMGERGLLLDLDIYGP